MTDARLLGTYKSEFTRSIVQRWETRHGTIVDVSVSDVVLAYYPNADHESLFLKQVASAVSIEDAEDAAEYAVII